MTVTKKLEVCVINVELIPLVQLHIIWKWKHPLEVATKTSLRSKKNLKT